MASSQLQHIIATWPWYLTRASGLTAAALLILLMFSGIGQVTGLWYRFAEPVTAWAIHKALGYALAVAIAIHGGTLLIDHFLPFSLIQVFVPFASTYSNKVPLFGLALGVLGVAVGILAMYGIAVIIVSSLVWVESKKRTWKLLHYVSYGVIILVFLHGLLVGTDLKHGAFRLLWLSAAGLVALAILIRLWRVGTLRTQAISPSRSSGRRNHMQF
jgi:sulfoxide reductase heme-binding subunit YedZ